jgi:uncharacterized membrane protein
LLFFALFLALVLATPIIAFTKDASGLYQLFAPTCHQKISRSMCIFTDFTVGDCTPQGGQYIGSASDRTQTVTMMDGKIGYKIPVCARDLGLYGAMLLAAIAYPFFHKIDDIYVPPVIYLIIAILPLAFDGSIQMLSDLGFLPFMYESTNLLRLITGIIAGGAATFYAIPLLMNMFDEDKRAPRASARK